MEKSDKIYGLSWLILGASHNLMETIKYGGSFTDEELFEIYSRAKHDGISPDDWYAHFLATRDFHTMTISNPGEPNRFTYKPRVTVNYEKT